ncbi:hypothetical protein B0H14DRAFT_2653334 [Mycena olivaceomarginata]|nr:hypothetical protein B0H14DRAFT_2653334 [Mycena olivaceomarginata]
MPSKKRISNEFKETVIRLRYNRRQKPAEISPVLLPGMLTVIARPRVLASVIVHGEGLHSRDLGAWRYEAKVAATWRAFTPQVGPPLLPVPPNPVDDLTVPRVTQMSVHKPQFPKPARSPINRLLARLSEWNGTGGGASERGFSRPMWMPTGYERGYGEARSSGKIARRRSSSSKKPKAGLAICEREATGRDREARTEIVLKTGRFRLEDASRPKCRFSDVQRRGECCLLEECAGCLIGQESGYPPAGPVPFPDAWKSEFGQDVALLEVVHHQSARPKPKSRDIHGAELGYRWALVERTSVRT